GTGRPGPPGGLASARPAVRSGGEDLRGGRPDVDDLGIAGRDGASGPDGPPATLRLSGKGGKQRIVPVGRYAREALDAYLVRARPTLAAGSRRARPSPAVFLNARGGRLTRQGAWGLLTAAAERT